MPAWTWASDEETLPEPLPTSPPPRPRPPPKPPSVALNWLRKAGLAADGLAACGASRADCFSTPRLSHIIIGSGGDGDGVEGGAGGWGALVPWRAPPVWPL